MARFKPAKLPGTGTLTHYVARSSTYNSPGRPDRVPLDPQDRLASILTTGRLWANRQWNMWEHAVCLSDHSQDETVRTFRSGPGHATRYEPWALQFHADRMGAHPVWRVSGEKRDVLNAIRAQIGTAAAGLVIPHEKGVIKKDWSHENEWRIVPDPRADGELPTVKIQKGDITAVIVGTPGWTSKNIKTRFQKVPRLYWCPDRRALIDDGILSGPSVVRTGKRGSPRSVPRKKAR